MYGAIQWISEYNIILDLGSYLHNLQYHKMASLDKSLFPSIQGEIIHQQIWILKYVNCSIMVFVYIIVIMLRKIVKPNNCNL